METLRHFVAVLYVLVFATLVLSRDIIGNEILPVCPRQDNPNGNATILPDPQNCTTFFICSNGQAYQFVCPSQLKFNNDLKVCDWPENVDCEDEGSGDIVDSI